MAAIFALFAVTWKITLKTASNKGSKNGTQNHFSESSMTLFRYFVCIFPKKQEWTVCCQDLASIQNGPAARCKLLLCPSTLPNWRNAVGLKSYARKALFKGSSKKNWHTDLFAVKDKPLSTTKIPKRSKLTSILM